MVSLDSLVADGGGEWADIPSFCRPEMSIFPSGLSQSFGAPFKAAHERLVVSSPRKSASARPTTLIVFFWKSSTLTTQTMPTSCVRLNASTRAAAASMGLSWTTLGRAAVATLRAEASTAGLRKAAGAIGENLQTQVEAGRALADELRFLLESGAATPTGIYPTTDATITADGSTVLASADDSEVSSPLAARSKAERELLKLMRQAR